MVRIVSIWLTGIVLLLALPAPLVYSQDLQNLLQTDHTFDAGSRVSLQALTPVQTRNEAGTREFSLKRQPLPAGRAAPTHDRPGKTFQRLDDDIAYIKLSSIKKVDVVAYMQAAQTSKGLIIDIRNYPAEFVPFVLGQYLVDKLSAFASFTQGDLGNPGAFYWGPTMRIPPGALHYDGKVMILLDEISQSQSEYTAMALRAAPRAKVVGSTTAGADGNVSSLALPFGLRTAISGLGVFYPDKRPTQRIGILPDIEVKPTIAGLRAGRDEVLEAAIAEIRRK